MTLPDRPAGPRPPLSAADARALALAAGATAAILVEGWSDQAALEALARRRGRDLRTEGLVVVPIGGVTNIDHFVQALGPCGIGLRLAGLYDVADAPHVRRSLRRAGFDIGPGDAGIEELGFFCCDADLEDELIRALGPGRVEGVLASEGELASFRRFQAQPDQRGRDPGAQLRRFMGTRAGRKIRYGSLLVEALDLAHVPRALDRALSGVRPAVQAPGGPLSSTTLPSGSAT